MSFTFPVSDRQFYLLRSEAKALASSKNIPLTRAQEVIALSHGLNHWNEIKQSNKAFKQHVADILGTPILFWDVKDAQGLDSDGGFLSYSDETTGLVLELLWEKSKVRNSLDSRTDHLVPFAYNVEANSPSELASKILQLYSDNQPEFVFYQGCFFPFQELRDASQNSEMHYLDLERLLVAHDLLEEAPKRSYSSYITGALNFLPPFNPSFESSFFECRGMTGLQVCDLIIDMRIELVFLIAPPEEVLEQVKLIMSNSLIEIIDPGF